MELRPLNNRVLVQRVRAAKVSAGGIHIPDSASEKTLRGKVLAISAGKRLKDGTLVPHDFAVGDVIVFEKFADTDLEGVDFGSAIKGDEKPEFATVEGDDILGVEERT